MTKSVIGNFCIIATVAIMVACSNNENPASMQKTSDKEAPAASSANDGSTPTAHTDDHTDEEKHSTVRSADSHTHGDAELAVVLEGNVVTVELDTPLYNLLGFEHVPETEVQKTSVKTAETRLQNGEQLFVFNAAAGCTSVSDNTGMSLFDADTDHDHEEHDDEHGEDHDTHEEDDHEDGEHADHEDAHKDVVVQYQFKCQKPALIANLNINLFEFFDELSEIDVTYLGPGVQRQVTLTRNNMQMDLSK